MIKRNRRSARMVSFMSSAKWRKVLRALDRCALAAPYCDIKFVSDPQVERSRIPRVDNLHYHYVADGPTQPFKFDQIEWLEIPQTYRHPFHKGIPAAAVRNDLSEIRRALEALGKIPLEETATGLRIIGYQIV